MATPKTTTLPLSSLHQHPAQQDLIGDISDHELKELIDDIRMHGLREPVEVLTDGTIVSGHQRVRAALQLGWTEIDVIVRSDLDGQDAGVIRRELIRPNLYRRQADKLTRARWYRELKTSEKSSPDSQLGDEDRRDLRDRIAALLGEVSGRTLDRYERILDLPRPLQDAVSQDKLAMTAALKIADFPPQRQQEIAQRIVAGEPAKQVAADYIKKPPRLNETDTPEDLYWVLLDFLRQYVDSLTDSIEQVVGTGMKYSLKIVVLEKSGHLFQRLLECEMRLHDHAVAEMRRMVEQKFSS